MGYPVLTKHSHISRYTEPFSMIPGWFESPESQLSNDTGTIKNGSVYIKIRALKKPITHLEIKVFAVTHNVRGGSSMM